MKKIFKTQIINFRKPNTGIWQPGPDVAADTPEEASKILEDLIIALCPERAHETVNLDDSAVTP